MLPFARRGSGVWFNRRDSKSRVPSLAPGVRIPPSPPASPRLCGFSARISEIARSCAFIRMLRGTGEIHFPAVRARDAAKVSVGK
jgi:hypothetical protein